MRRDTSAHSQQCRLLSWDQHVLFLIRTTTRQRDSISCTVCHRSRRSPACGGRGCSWGRRPRRSRQARVQQWHGRSLCCERTMPSPSHTYECFNLSYYENMFCKHRGIVVDLSTKIALNFGLSVYIGIPSVYPFGLQVKSGRNCK